MGATVVVDVGGVDVGGVVDVVVSGIDVPGAARGVPSVVEQPTNARVHAALTTRRRRIFMILPTMPGA